MQWHRNRDSRRPFRAHWLVLGSALAVALANVGVPTSRAEERASPPVPLDQLLTLPSGLPVQSPSAHGGATRVEWRQRFTEAQEEIVKARTELDDTLDRLKNLAAETGGMKVSGPGTGGAAVNPDAPMNYGLSQEIRRKREALERAERELVELKVEANLAGVPPEWVEDPAASEP